ncbi:MAG TPA: hypothetical protein VF572_06930 [Candidatus Saccharimonadales bacterium]|jgi:xanthine/uracil permease
MVMEVLYSSWKEVTMDELLRNKGKLGILAGIGFLFVALMLAAADEFEGRLFEAAKGVAAWGLVIVVVCAIWTVVDYLRNHHDYSDF